MCTPQEKIKNEYKMLIEKEKLGDLGIDVRITLVSNIHINTVSRFGLNLS